MVLAKLRFNLRERDIHALGATFVPFSAQSRMSGVNIEARIIRKGAARIVQVTDSEIGAAIRAYWTDTHNLAEGAGAAPLAAALSEKNRLAGRRVGLILTGGNIDFDLFQRWVGTDVTPGQRAVA